MYRLQMIDIAGEGNDKQPPGQRRGRRSDICSDPSDILRGGEDFARVPQKCLDSGHEFFTSGDVGCSERCDGFPDSQNLTDFQKNFSYLMKKKLNF